MQHHFKRFELGAELLQELLEASPGLLRCEVVLLESADLPGQVLVLQEVQVVPAGLPGLVHDGRTPISRVRSGTIQGGPFHVNHLA